MAAAAAGDRAAFRAFVERHQPAVFRYARRLTGSPSDAEDVLQETFLAAHRSLGSFRGDASARSWLLTIARHAALRRLRRPPAEPTDDKTLAELGVAAGWGAADPDPEHLASAAEARQLVARALAALPVDDREVLVLRELEGLSGEETAAVLGIGLPAMKSRLHRARLRFAAVLREGDVDGP